MSKKKGQPISLSDFANKLATDKVFKAKSQKQHTGFESQYVPGLSNYKMVPFGMDENKFLHDNQSVWDATKNTAKQFGGNLVAGFAQTASTWDPTLYGDLYGDKEDADFTNALFEWGKEFQSDIARENPIYASKPGKFDPGEGAYWLNQTASLGYSSGIALEMLAENFIMNLAMPGSGVVSTGLKGTRLANMLRKSNTFKNMYNQSKKIGLLNKVKQAGFGSFKGFSLKYFLIL